MRDTIIYIGGFELPDKNAAALSLKRDHYLIYQLLRSATPTSAPKVWMKELLSCVVCMQSESSNLSSWWCRNTAAKYVRFLQSPTMKVDRYPSSLPG